MIVDLKDLNIEVEFPDDMPLDQAAELIKKRFYPEISPDTPETLMAETGDVNPVPEGASILGSHLKGLASSVGAGFMEGVGSLGKTFASNLETIGRGAVQDPFGAEMEPAAKDLEPTNFGGAQYLNRYADFLIYNADYLKKVADANGATEAEKIVAEVFGGAPAGITGFMLGPGWAALSSYSRAAESGQDEFLGAVKGAGTWFLLKGIFESVSGVKPTLRVPAMAGTGAASAYAEGERDPSKLARAGMELAVLETGVSMARGARPGTRGAKEIASEFAESVRPEAKKEPAAKKALAEARPDGLYPPDESPNVGEVPEGWVHDMTLVIRGKVRHQFTKKGEGVPKGDPMRGFSVSVDEGGKLADSIKAKDEARVEGEKARAEMEKMEAEALKVEEKGYVNPFRVRVDERKFKFVDSEEEATEIGQRANKYETGQGVDIGAGLSLKDLGNKKYIEDTLKKTGTLSPVDVPGIQGPQYHKKTGKPIGLPRDIKTDTEYETTIDAGVADAEANWKGNQKSAFWYEEVGDTIKKLARLKENPDGTWSGDLELAEDLARLVTFYSADNSVAGNATALVNTIYEISRGVEKPAHGRYPNVSKELIPAIRKAQELGRDVGGFNNKTLSFYRNIFDAITGHDSGAVTLDIWMLRNLKWKNASGKTPNSLNEAQYGFARKMILDITSAFNRKHGTKLLPRQMQALLWDYEQGGRRGVERPRGDYEAFLHRQRVTGEVMPSKTVPGMEELHGADNETKRLFQEDQWDIITGESGQDLILEKLGVKLSIQREGAGTYGGVETPNVLTDIIPEGKRATGYSTDLADAYAKLWGYIYTQDAVPWYNADFNMKAPIKGRSTGVALSTEKGWLKPMRDAFYERLQRELPGAEYSVVDGELHLVNFRGEDGKPFVAPDPDFVKTVNEVATSVEREFGVEVKSTLFRASSGYPTNDWTKEVEGSGYTTGLGEAYGQDLLDWARGRREESRNRREAFVREAFGEAPQEGRAETPEAEVRPAGKPADRIYGAPGGGTEGRVVDVGERVNRFISDVTPVGLSTAETTIDDTIAGIKSVNPKTEAWWKRTKGAAALRPGLTERLRQWASEMKRTFTRHFEHLDPKTDGATIDSLRRYQEVSEVSKTNALQVIKGITAGFGPNKYELFRRNIILPDLLRDVESGLYTEVFDAGRPENTSMKKIPGYESVADMRADLENWQKLLEANPDVKEAVDLRNRFMVSLRDDLISAGLLDSEQAKGPYFHHQVLSRMAEKRGLYPGTSSADVRTHQKGWQKPRKGAPLDYNTEYVEAEFEVIAQSFSQLATKKTLGEVKGHNDISDNLKAQAKERMDAAREKYEDALNDPTLSIRDKVRLKTEAEKRIDWRDLLPEGYVIWQPKPGNYFYRVNSLTERQLDNLLLEGENLGLDEIPSGWRFEGENVSEIMKQVVALGSKREQWAIPERIATTLDNFRDFRESNILARGSRQAMTSWKQWTLLNPWRVVKYNLNNLSGDTDIVVAYDYRILKHAGPKTWKELWDYHMKGKAFSKDMQEAIKHGLSSSGQAIQEIPDVSEQGVFRVLFGDRAHDQSWLRRYWNGVSQFTMWRENILRLAAYKHFKAELAKGKKLYAASKPEEVDAIANTKERAAKLSRELIGDYGNISRGGEIIRTHVRPFHSWTEINAPRYVRLLKNAPIEGGSTAGRATRKGIGLTARTTAKVAFKAMILYSLVSLYNKSMWPKEEEELSDYQRRQGHLILGRNEDGSVKTLRFQGALSDALAIFGLESPVEDVKAIAAGEKTVAEEAEDIAKAPFNYLWSGARPEKGIIETIGGVSTYPDVFNPRPVRDRKEEIAKTLSLEMPYRYLAGKPTKGINQDLQNVYSYRSDPGESAYNSLRGLVIEFKRKKGSDFSMGAPSEKSNALYYYRQAVKWGDKAAQTKYLNRYYELGGTEKGLSTSIKRAHPLAMLRKDEKDEFLAGLSPRQKKVMERAIDWYERTYTGTGSGGPTDEGLKNLMK